ncbi:MAG TPA: immunity 8 family protein [Chthoniobacterales bacterium]|nr:immunity 8 family protein [Chthoniobacterales bacterium]
MKMRIKGYHSPDVDHLESYLPADAELFSILLQIIVTPENLEGEESFDLLVCTPRYLQSKLASDGTPIFGTHMLIVGRYDFRAIRRVIEDYCDNLDEPNWEKLASKLARIARWEFQDYDQVP